jgi:hypothetical protein
MPRLSPVVLAFTLILASAANAATITQSFTQSARVRLNATSSGCSNNPGPFITLNGELSLSGVNARIILTNNQKWTHVASTDVTAYVVLIPAGHSIRIAKQPPRGGVGGNPWIYLQFNDCKGKSLGAPTLLGRCVQGLNPANLDFQIPTGATTTVSGGCSNHPGPYITLNGELRLGGLCATLILTNNARFTHVTSADVVVEVVLIPEGESITFAKQPPLGGAGGNPLVYIQFLNASGQPLGSPILAGRCNKL